MAGNYTVTLNTSGLLVQSITIGSGASPSQGTQTLRILSLRREGKLERRERGGGRVREREGAPIWRVEKVR